MVEAKPAMQGSWRRHNLRVTGHPDRHTVVALADPVILPRGKTPGMRAEKAMLVIDRKHNPPLFP